MLIIGHRGACALEPENTLRSIQRAIDLGVDMIEIDIYRCDDHLIVFHDETLDRTTNGTGSLADHSFSQLRALDAGKGERIPILTEVLDLTRGKVLLNIEIKGKNVVHLLHKTIQDERGILLSSMDWHQLRAYRAINSAIPIGVLGINGFATAEQLNACSIHPHLSEINSDYMLRAKRQELFVYLYTIRNDSDWELAQEHGVDGCFVDDPSLYH